MEEIRLNKYIAQCGICSRRDADKLIENGRVTVDGQPATAGMKISDQEVCVDGLLIGKENRKVVLAYYKPVGVTCTERDEHAEVKVTDVIDYPIRVTYAGRLDRDSEGLLLLTNDGDLIDAMMRGSNKHEKEYQVTVDRKLGKSFTADFANGIYLKELNITTRPCLCKATGDNSFTTVLTQGVNRQIRRMCATLGYQVKKLKRVRVMTVQLGDLKPGEYRELSAQEMEELYSSCKN